MGLNGFFSVGRNLPSWFRFAMAGRRALKQSSITRRDGTAWSMLPCARITSIRFKGTFSVAPWRTRRNTPSESGNLLLPRPALSLQLKTMALAGGIQSDVWPVPTTPLLMRKRRAAPKFSHPPRGAWRKATGLGALISILNKLWFSMSAPSPQPSPPRSGERESKTPSPTCRGC